MLLGTGLLAGGVYGLSHLKQNLDLIVFYPPDSSPRKFTENVRIVIFFVITFILCTPKIVYRDEIYFLYIIRMYD